VTVPAARRGEIVFTLSGRGARLLKTKHQIPLAALTITARTGRGAAVGNASLFSLYR